MPLTAKPRYEMTPRERVQQALQFRQTDIVPYNVGLTSEARRKLVDYWGPDFESQVGNHLAWMSLRQFAEWTEVEPGCFRDEWGVVWNRRVDMDTGVIERFVLTEPSLEGFEFPDPSPKPMAEIYPPWLGQTAGLFRIAGIGFSLFERAWTLRGMEHLLADMLHHPGFVHDLFDRIVDWNLTQVEMALKHDIDCVYFGDDWGSQSGLIMGPRLWREFIKPRVARMYQRVRDAGKFVMIHSCGDVKEVLPDLVEVGLNVFNPFQPETMDVYETKKLYYGRLSFYGAISVQRLLPYGTPDEVRSETRKLLRELGRGGGYIASPSHAVPGDTPVENLVAMIETLRGQG